MNRLTCLAAVCLIAASPACSSTSSRIDSASDGPRPADAKVAVDRAAPDQPSRDRSSGDRSSGDRSPLEMRLPDTRSPDKGPACAYNNIDEKLVKCGPAYKYVQLYQLVTGPSGCSASYWVVSGASGQHPTPADAALAAGCSTQCIWNKAVSASLLYCGHKTGYIRFDAPDRGCAPVYQCPGGYYPSWEAYTTAHPCLDGGPAAPG